MARNSVLLPLPLGTEQHQEFALLDLQRDVVDDRDGLIPLGHLVERDGHADPGLAELDPPS